MGNINRIVKWVALTLLFVLCSCESAPKVPKDPIVKPAASSTGLQSLLDNTEDNVQDIERDSKIIIAESATAVQALDTVYPVVEPEHKPAVDSAINSLHEIDSKADNILEAAADLDKETQKLETLVQQVDQLEDQLVKLNSAVETSRGKALEKLYGYITMFWVIGFSLLAIGAAVAFFLNKAYGASIVLLGLLMVGFASASQYYMEQIAQVGAVLLIAGFLVGVGMISWEVFKAKRTDEAIKEVVEIVEILKESMTDSEKDRIFGPDGVVSRVQSDFTKQLVAKIREKNGFKTLKEVKTENTKPA